MVQQVKRFLLNCYMLIKEKKYKENGTRIKYLLYPGSKDSLVVVFSAYNKNKAVYNYVRSLNHIKSTRLYILDDFGPTHTGSYYLGEKARHNVEPTVISLVKFIRKRYGLGDNTKLIFAGSSKGGYAALNFAVEFDNSFAIVGAPQYFLGSHLNEPFFYPMLEDIFGEITEEKIADLDRHIQNKYLSWNKDYKQSVYIQYSAVEWSSVFKEYTYEKHIKYLISDIKMHTGIDLYEQVLDYKDHNDVYKYYPHYLIENIERITNK